MTYRKLSNSLFSAQLLFFNYLLEITYQVIDACRAYTQHFEIQVVTNRKKIMFNSVLLWSTKESHIVWKQSGIISI